MARDFDGSNDEINFGDIPILSDAVDFSLSGWLWANNTSADHAFIDNYNGSVGCFIYQDNTDGGTGRTDTFSVDINGSSGGSRLVCASNSAIANQWQHLFVGSESGSSTGLQAWIDGVEDANSPNSLSSMTDQGKSSDNWFLGETQGVSRDRDGKIAEVGMWTRILTDPEIIALSKGFSPLFFPDGLEFYAPLFGRLSPEPDIVGGTTGTLAGTAAIEHPPTIYPSSQTYRMGPAAVAAATRRYSLPLIGVG